MILNFFKFDALAIISASLILFIASVVGFYSRNYLRGDRKQKQFFVAVAVISATLIATISADNIVVMFLGWLLSNLLLVLMMIYKTSWRQAVNSGLLALRNFLLGSLALASALTVLHLQTDSYQISEILNHQNIDKTSAAAAVLLIAIAALSQAAIYPFHSWLISSLNSPTPTSALMHAGLVNGGGILLARFSSLILQQPQIMAAIFILGISSALIGTLWKLMQSNVKSMLACSTLSQMGFMMAQCGMGLFSAAVAHLLWHGMFKSYLFLSAAGSWREKRWDSFVKTKPLNFLISLGCGAFAATIFSQINGFSLSKYNTTAVLISVTFIAASQIALTIIADSLKKNLMPALVLSLGAATFYGASVLFIEKILPTEMFAPQQLNAIHTLGIVLLFGVWFAKLFWRSFVPASSRFAPKIYVKLLNSSQPNSSTLTSNRNHYNFL